MKILIKPIAFNESSYNVALLQKTLEVLGLPVSQKEVKHDNAGEETRPGGKAIPIS